MSQKRVSEDLLKGKTYFDYATLCKFKVSSVAELPAAPPLITLRVNANALVVCREWKKCKGHGGKGCAEKYFQDRFNNELSKREGPSLAAILGIH